MTGLDDYSTPGRPGLVRAPAALYHQDHIVSCMAAALGAKGTPDASGSAAHFRTYLQW